MGPNSKSSMDNAVHTSQAYAGDIDAKEAWAALKSDSNTMLVDVRTEAEWNFVGVPDLSGIEKQPLFVEWQIYPSMDLNPGFLQSIAAVIMDKSSPIYFLCRSGARSRSAAVAATAAGYGVCYNVSEGFEGHHDENRHRGGVGGWKASCLPWVQG